MASTILNYHELAQVAGGLENHPDSISTAMALVTIASGDGPHPPDPPR